MRRLLGVLSVSVLLCGFAAEGATAAAQTTGRFTGRLSYTEATHYHGSRFELRTVRYLATFRAGEQVFKGLARTPLIAGDTGFQQLPPYRVEPFTIRGVVLVDGRTFVAKCAGAHWPSGFDASQTPSGFVITATCSGGYLGRPRATFPLTLTVTAGIPDPADDFVFGRSSLVVGTVSS